MDNLANDELIVLLDTESLLVCVEELSELLDVEGVEGVDLRVGRLR